MAPALRELVIEEHLWWRTQSNLFRFVGTSHLSKIVKTERELLSYMNRVDSGEEACRGTGWYRGWREREEERKRVLGNGQVTQW